MIVAFSGVKFSGKDTTAEGLIRFHKFKRIGLADKLKDICSEVFDIPRQDMDNPALKEFPFPKPVKLSVEHLDSLLRTLQRDGYDFEFDSIFQLLCTNFMGKILTSIRDILQVIGTDICRTHIKDDIWLQYVKQTILTYDGNLVITDARFENERKFLKELGAVLVLVIRPGYENKSTHISENQLGNPEDYDVIVRNDTTPIAVQSGIATWYTVMKDAIKSSKFRRN